MRASGWLKSWIGLKERPEHFVLTPDQTHPYRDGLRFAGLGGGYCAKSMKFHDSSLYGNHGTLVGYTGAGNTPADQWSRALGRNVLGFDGNGDRVSRPIIRISGEVTRAGWVKRNTGFPFLNDVNAATWNNGAMFGVETTGQLMFWTPASGWRYGNAVMNSVSLHHIAVVLTMSGGTFYVNGRFDSSWVASGGIVSATVEGYIGKGFDSTTYIGTASDPCEWSRALSPSEITALADPSNVMLSGLILPVWRRVYGAAVAPSGNRRRRLLIAGARR